MRSNKVSILIERVLNEELDLEDEFPTTDEPDATLESGLDADSDISIEDLVTQGDIANQEKINNKYREVFVDAYEQISKLSDIITMLKDPSYSKGNVEQRNLIQNIALLAKLKPEEKASLGNNDKLIKKAANSISEVITNFDSLASNDKELADAISGISKDTDSASRGEYDDYESMFINK